MGVPSMTEAVARLRARRKRLTLDDDPLRPRGPKRPDQRFVPGDQLTPQQTAEIEALNRANVTPAGSRPDPQRCPFPSLPQPRDDGVPWR
jgi:hypothetical protein